MRKMGVGARQGENNERRAFLVREVECGAENRADIMFQSCLGSCGICALWPPVGFYAIPATSCKRLEFGATAFAHDAPPAQKRKAPSSLAKWAEPLPPPCRSRAVAVLAAPVVERGSRSASSLPVPTTLSMASRSMGQLSPSLPRHSPVPPRRWCRRRSHQCPCRSRRSRCSHRSRQQRRRHGSFAQY